MLRTGLYACALHTKDSLIRRLSGQEWISAESFPISTTLRNKVRKISHECKNLLPARLAQDSSWVRVQRERPSL